KGIDTIIVVRDVDASPARVPLQDRPLHPDAIVKAVKDVFKAEQWIAVDDQVPDGDYTKPSLMILKYSITAWPDSVDGKPVTVASLTVQFQPPRNLTGSSFIPPQSTAFIIPSTVDAYDSKIAAAFEKMFSYLPGYFACAHQTTFPWHHCLVSAASSWSREGPI